MVPSIQKRGSVIMSNYSDYIVYVDESGDHGLKSIDSNYPIFSLAFCIFKKSTYIQKIGPDLNHFKSKFWGHCDVVLHERDIRKCRTGDWSLLANEQTRENFFTEINTLIENSNFHIIACVINKYKLTRYQKPKNPYELAMLFCMERLNNWLVNMNQTGKIVQVHCESRGGNEDNDLKDEFHQICSNNSTSVTSKTDFSKITYCLRNLDKRVNSTGLQLADLVARPIGLFALRPDQHNRAFDIIKSKFITHSNGDYLGKGLKIFP